VARGAGGFDPAGRATLLHVVLRLGCCRSTRSVPDFLAKGPTWLNDFTPHVRVKLQRFTQLRETHLRNLHARIAHLNKTARKEEESSVARRLRSVTRWRSPSSRPRRTSPRARPSSHPCARCRGSGASGTRSACESSA